MFRRIVGGFALAAVLATGANAQFTVGSPTQNGFTFDGHAAAIDGGGYNFYSYTGNFNIDDARTGVGTSVFQVFCVDPDHFIGEGNSFNVTVTPLSATDFSSTRIGNGSLYAQAATLASFMMAGNNPVTLAYNQNIEYAMWEVLGYGAFSSDPGYDASAVAADILAAQSAPAISLNQWLVITINPLDDGGPQELLYNTTSRPEEATPEPGTMALMATGLVGMAGASFRRRRRNK